MSPLYTQCLKCVSVQLSKAKVKLRDPMERIKAAFMVSDEFHSKHLNGIQGYSKQDVLALLIYQRSHLDEHPLYTKESFDEISKDLYDQWLKVETERLTKMIDKLQEKKVEPGSEPRDAWDGIESDSCPFFAQLFVSLVSFDRNSLLVDENAEQRVTTFIAQAQRVIMEDVTQTHEPINFDKLFPNNSGIDILLALSPFSTWLLDEYSERYAIRPLYRQITHLAYLAPLLRHNMRQMILTHIVLSRAFDQIQNPATIFNMAEFTFFKETVKRLWKDVRLNFLSNIIRYFSSANIPNLIMMIKLLVLLSEVMTWLKNRLNKQFTFNYKSAMRELITNSFRNHYQELLYQVESKRTVPPSSDPNDPNPNTDLDRLVPAKPSFLGANKTLTPLQLTNVATELWNSLPRLHAFDEVLAGARLDLIATARQEYFTLLTADVKFFVRKYLRDYRTSAVLGLSVKYRQIAEVSLRLSLYNSSFPLVSF